MKLNKILSVALMVVMVLATLTNVVNANNAFNLNPGSVQGNTANLEGVSAIGNRIVGALQAVGTIISIAIIIVLGIKYMMGSSQEKAEYKKTMIPYIVGAILIFAASNIAGWVYSWANAIS